MMPFMYVFYHAIWSGNECRDAGFVRPSKMNGKRMHTIG